MTRTVSPSVTGTVLTNVVSASGATPGPDDRNNRAHRSNHGQHGRPAHRGQGRHAGSSGARPGRRLPDHRGELRAVGLPRRRTRRSLPEGLTVRTPGPTASRGSCEMVGRTASCALGTLRAGQSTVVRIPINVDPGLGLTTVTNTAAITSTTPDTDPIRRAHRHGDDAGDSAGRPDPGEDRTGCGPRRRRHVLDTHPDQLRTVRRPAGDDQRPVPAAVTGLATSATQGRRHDRLEHGDLRHRHPRTGRQRAEHVVRHRGGRPVVPGRRYRQHRQVSSPTPNRATTGAGRSSPRTPTSAAADLSSPRSRPRPPSRPARSRVDGDRHESRSVDRDRRRATDQLPAALRNPVFTDTGGSVLSCPAGVCKFATLAPGDAATVVVPGPWIRTSPRIDHQPPVWRLPPQTRSRGDDECLVAGAGGRVGQPRAGQDRPEKRGRRRNGDLVDRGVNPDGPSTARGVRVTDDLPAGITDITVTTPASIICPAHPDSGSTLTCDLPDLVAGAAPLTIRISATVVAGHPGRDPGQHCEGHIRHDPDRSRLRR